MHNKFTKVVGITYSYSCAAQISSKNRHYYKALNYMNRTLVTSFRSSFLIIFYDGYCPLCMAEMNHLRKRDKHQRLKLVDIQDPDFSVQYPTLDWHALNARIHALRDDGTLMTGLDVTHEAWKAVGMGWVYAPLRWPVIRIFADMFYNVFAKHRYTISFLLTGKKRTCERCIPGEPNGE